MLGQLYEEALGGERCWLRHDDGRRHRLPVHSWLGGHGADQCFDRAVVELCQGPTIDLGCGPGRLVTHLIQRGIPALGVDQSETAVRLARRSGAPVLLADGNVGLGGDPWRVLRRAAELISATGRCVVEFEAAVAGVRSSWVRLESSDNIGPWFRWASVGVDYAASLAREVGLAVIGIHPIGDRVVATLAPE